MYASLNFTPEKSAFFLSSSGSDSESASDWSDSDGEGNKTKKRGLMRLSLTPRKPRASDGARMAWSDDRSAAEESQRNRPTFRGMN